MKDIVWTTKEGKEMTMAEITDSHLLNIILHIERRAENGIEVEEKIYHNDSVCFDTIPMIIEGDEVKEALHYDLFFKEAMRRCIFNTLKK